MLSVRELEAPKHPEVQRSRNPYVWLCIASFTIFYFVDVLLRASAKYFWYDEILTLYFARLPGLHSLWGALQSGLESNPPAFHLLTRATEAIFGEGLVATRLPEIISFWVMCLCLFYFVERRAGVIAGFIAMVLPMLTGVYYYAYEARPLIIVAACAGLAVVCWDHSKQAFHRNAWLLGFSLALFAAFMMHCYAILLMIPFGIAELARDLRGRDLNWRFWIAWIAPLLPASFLYIPLLRAFRAAAKGTDFAITFPPLWPEVLRFYSFLLLPCSAILILALSLFALDRVARPGKSVDEKRRVIFDWDDALLSGGFAALPVFGIVVAQLVHSPYFTRYFLSAIFGFCIPFALLAGDARARTWVRPVLTTVICVSLALNLGRIIRHRIHGEGENLIEPSTSMWLSTTPGKPLANYPLIRSITRGDSKPIAMLEPLDFLYLVEYAPELRPRLYYIHSFEADAQFRGLGAFLPWSPVKYNPVLIGRDFVRKYPSLYIYSDVAHLEEFYRLSKLASIKSFKAMEGHFLVSMLAEQPAEQVPQAR